MTTIEQQVKAKKYLENKSLSDIIQLMNKYNLHSSYLLVNDGYETLNDYEEALRQSYINMLYKNIIVK